MGEAVDEVDVGAADAAPPGAGEHLAGDLGRLHPVDRPLHLGVEVLDAEADAVDAGLGEGVEVGRGAAPRIDLDRDLGAGGEREVAADGRHQQAATSSGSRKVGVPPPQWSWTARRSAAPSSSAAIAISRTSSGR